MSFLYFFLPLTVIFYFICRNRVWRNCVLLFSSLLFYSWGEPKYLALMLAASLLAYVGGLLLARLRNRPRGKRAVLSLCIFLLIGNLVVFKYLNFVVDNLNSFTGSGITIGQIALPVGISFYTFQILSYLVDLYRGKVAVQKNFFYFTLYVSFFPQLIAGPIVRYQTVEEEINHRRENWNDVIYGARRFIFGLAKKVILANNMGRIAAFLYGSELEGVGTAAYWLAALTYALQIYFDFSGYSDMAIGLGRVFGFHFLENFNYPYLSTSITDFWRRWHISLSTWFRDYVYIPLGGNRVSKWRWIFNILVVWALTGLWHGASWNFVIWGLYYAGLLLIEKFFLLNLLKKLPAFFGWLYASFFTLLGWVVFNLTNFEQMVQTLRAMFVYVQTDWVTVFASDASIFSAFLFLPLAILFAFPVFRRVHMKDDSVFVSLLTNLGLLGLLALSIMFIVSSSFNPFIYFRF